MDRKEQKWLSAFVTFMATARPNLAIQRRCIIPRHDAKSIVQLRNSFDFGEAQVAESVVKKLTEFPITPPITRVRLSDVSQNYASFEVLNCLFCRVARELCN